MSKNGASVAREARRHGDPALTAVPTPPPAAEMQVGPLPVTTAVSQANTPDGMLVVLQVQTPQGISVFFLSPAHATTLAGQLESTGGAAGAGLIVPGGGV